MTDPNFATGIADGCRILLRPLLGRRKVGQTYANKRVVLDACDYVDCYFTNCEMVFYGRRCVIPGATMINCNFSFKGPAARSVKFLSGLYNAEGSHSLREAIDKALASSSNEILPARQ